MTWNLACPDWEARLREGRSLVPPLPLDLEAGNRAVAVFDRLRLPDVPGQPTLAEAAGDWFRDMVRALFGSIDPVSGQRMIRELFCLVPKKNSKTSYGALMMLVALLLNMRPKAKYILTGPTQDIADLAFSQAKGAVELDGVLRAKLHIRDHLKTIIHRQTGAELEIMTFDPSVLTGQKPAGILIDELHRCATMAKAASAIRQLRGGMLPIPEAFLAFITTQSEEAPAGVMRAELLKARAVRDGRLAASLLPVLYEFPEAMQRDEAQWRDPKHWPMVTPNRGRSITVERLREDYDMAAAVGAEELRAWASQHLNVEVGLALHSDRWAGADYWPAAAEAGLTLDDLLARCDVVVAGIDGGGLDDLLSLAFIGRERETRTWLHWAHAWADHRVLDRRKEIAPRLLDLAAAGELSLVEMLGDDIEELVALVKRVRDAGLLPEKNAVGVDPAGIGAIVDALAEEQIADAMVVGVPQGWKINGAIKTTERKVRDGTLLHGGQPLMDWAVGNAKVEPRGNAISITKAAAGVAKIDPLIATFNAVALMAMNPLNTADAAASRHPRSGYEMEAGAAAAHAAGGRISGYEAG